ncbi:NAD(P)/FAD-dependent oxidoreductase [Streptomyces sp. GbtcB7]|uniref:FAD-dependent oxidoreductase n=1 Tax=Streptomyces sp. GbtcB7 TaxID=2824752 RepID=UPI001C30D6C5|nr:NAD(P)/FAD-dependent oxidoreductase [Streptomyces sp. GbtcB7]
MPDGSVLVVGGGPVGLLTALGLAQSGVGVTLLEARPQVSEAPHDMVYHWSTLPGIERLGILPDMLHAGLTEHQWCFGVLRSGERIFFDLGSLSDETEHTYSLHLPQHLLADIVLARLSGMPHAEVVWNTRVVGLEQDDHGVTVTAEGPGSTRTFRVGWVVGADGAHSRVRRSLGIGFAGMTWPVRFVAADVRFDFTGLGFTRASYQIDPDHGALLGQADRSGLWRYIYAESRLLPEETVPDRMPAVFKTVLPEGADPGLRGWSSYRVHERTADRFRVGRVVLAGDAAHVTNPSSAFGLACGLFDTFVLTEALAAVAHGEADPGVLDRYAKERRRVFVDRASPLSSESMRLVFRAGSGARFDAEVEHYRKVASDPGLRREFFMLGKDLESPSLL